MMKKDINNKKQLCLLSYLRSWDMSKPSKKDIQTFIVSFHYLLSLYTSTRLDKDDTVCQMSVDDSHAYLCLCIAIIMHAEM